MLRIKGDMFLVSRRSQIREIRNYLQQNIFALKKSEEIFCLYTYLYFLSNSNDFSFPLEILKNESPDFVLNKTIGLEVVQLSTEKENHAMAIMRKEYPDYSLLEIDYYTPDSQADIREGIRKPGEPLRGSGFGDFGMENAWLSCIYATLSNKTSLLNKKHFTKYHSNQLIICDETQYCSDIDYILLQLRDKYKPTEKCLFNHVHIVNIKEKKENNTLFIADVFGKCTQYIIPQNYIKDI